METPSTLERIKTFISANNIDLRFPVASPEAIANTVAALGFELPPLLKACYAQIGNGGFGPGLGVIGVEGGFASDYGDIISTYRRILDDQSTLGNVWQRDLVPFCTWGCTILSCVKCDATEQVWTHDSGDVWPQDFSLQQLFEMWMDGVDLLSLDPNVSTSNLTFNNPFTAKTITTKRPRRKGT